MRESILRGRQGEERTGRDGALEMGRFANLREMDLTTPDYANYYFYYGKVSDAAAAQQSQVRTFPLDSHHY